MTLLVTGGAGFIGSNFIFYWMKHYPEDRVICVDKLTYAGNIAALQPMMDRPNFRFCHLDICDRDGIERLFEDERPDIVVNFAAESHVDRSIESPEIFFDDEHRRDFCVDGCMQKVRYPPVSPDFYR